MVLKTQQWLIQESAVGIFEEITAFFVEISLKIFHKSLKQQKSTLLDKLIPIFVQTTKVFEEKNFQWPERLNNKVLKKQLEKKWDEVHRVYNKGVKASELSLFSTT